MDQTAKYPIGPCGAGPGKVAQVCEGRFSDRLFASDLDLKRFGQGYSGDHSPGMICTGVPRLATGRVMNQKANWRRTLVGDHLKYIFF